MKLYFYKSILIFFLFLLGFHFSVGHISKKLNNLKKDTLSKDTFEAFKNKAREEIKTALEKEDYIKPEDAELINKFLEKIKSDLDKNR